MLSNGTKLNINTAFRKQQQKCDNFFLPTFLIEKDFLAYFISGMFQNPPSSSPESSTQQLQKHPNDAILFSPSFDEYCLISSISSMMFLPLEHLCLQAKNRIHIQSCHKSKEKHLGFYVPTTFWQTPFHTCLFHTFVFPAHRGWLVLGNFHCFAQGQQGRHVCPWALEGQFLEGDNQSSFPERSG